MEDNGKRPWGYFEVLADAEDHKVKRIVVAPGGCLSLQRHRMRAEHWYAVSGKGLVTLDGDKQVLEARCSVNIPQGAIHRLQNTSDKNLIIIEIQTGTYFGEDDIERLEDKYGRS